MANNYIPGFTPSLHSQPVKRMALGGRMESGRWFDEGRDRDTGDISYTSDVASAAPAATVAYQSHPTAQPVETAPYYADYGFDPLYQTPQSGLAQAEQPATPPGALPAGMSWGAYSNPNDPTSQYVVNFSGKNKNNPLKVGPDTPVFLYDNRTKQIVAAGVGREGADAVAAAASSLGAKKDDAWWDIYTGPAGATDPSQFKVALSDAKNRSLLGKIADIALPVLGSILLPGVGGIAGALGSVGSAAAGSALGSALSGTLQGRDFGDILKGAALSGATAGLIKAPILGGGQSISGALGSALQGAGNVGGNVAGQAVADRTGDIVVTGLSKGAQAAGTALAGGALNTLFNNTLLNTPFDQATKQPVAQQPALNEGPGWDVLASKGNVPADVIAGGAGGIAGTVPGAGTYYPDQGLTEVTGDAKKPDLPSAPTPSVTTPPSQTLPDNEIVVTANKPTTKLPDSVGAILGAIPSLATNLPQTPAATTDANKKLGVEDYLRIAGLLASAFGTAGKKTPSDMSGLIGVRGPLSPVFSASLPSANLPAATARPATALPRSTEDWYRYGYGPEQSFFSNVPQGAPNTGTAYTGYAEGGAAGTGPRSTFAVGGPGDGRDDKIPAMLSDGEYVIDAETVAMLGNGSSKAGADALDKFRVNIRKHKGRKLSKGEFSVDAKKPEQYLKGHK